MKVAKNYWYAGAVKKNYSQHPWLSISDLATRKMQAYYLAAHHAIKIKKNIQTMVTFTEELCKYTIAMWKNKGIETVTCLQSAAIKLELYCKIR